MHPLDKAGLEAMAEARTDALNFTEEQIERATEAAVSIIGNRNECELSIHFDDMQKIISALREPEPVDDFEDWWENRGGNGWTDRKEMARHAYEAGQKKDVANAALRAAPVGDAALREAADKLQRLVREGVQFSINPPDEELRQAALRIEEILSPPPPTPDLLAEAIDTLSNIAADASITLDDLPDHDQPNGWRKLAVERIDMARDTLAKLKAAQQPGEQS